MSSSRRQSWQPGRRLNASKDFGKPRTQSMSQVVVDHDEARSFALRTAYLHYLLQPKAKRKQYVPAPKQPARSHTSVGQLVQEFVSGSHSSLKLPHNFANPLLDRFGGVLRGSEALPGYSDAAVKRSFAEAYTAFSEKNFRKTIDKERKFEPLVLIFYSAATKAAQKGKAHDDDAWKMLPDRHLAMFVRLAVDILREQGHDRDRPELMSSLTTLESKLLRNDQNLVSNSADGTGTTIEVIVPLSYEVKDMPMVQVVATIFGLNLSDVQAELNEHRQLWTEEAALKDLKSYQQRLNSDMPGALRSHDFDVEDAFCEWKKAEASQLSQMMLDILTAKPELAKTKTGSVDKLLTSRPQSMYGEDQAYADLSRVISGGDENMVDPTVSLGSLSIGDSSPSIRTVDEVIYTFLPPNPRAFYKYIFQYAMTFDQIHADPNMDFEPLSKQSWELMTELCVRWRIPQSSRLIVTLEAAARKFLDREIVPEDLDTVFELIKSPQPECKKAPHINHYTAPLTDLDKSRWTMYDFSAYQHTLHSLYDALLRDLHDLLEACYDTKPPNIGAVMCLLEDHIGSDAAFSPKTDSLSQFQQHLTDRLVQKAADTYREHMQKAIPEHQEDWDFGHVVQLGKAVTKLCDRIRKRYKKTSQFMGVDPLSILLHQVFPRFEQDANAIIQIIMQHAHETGQELDIQDGFELYRELCVIRVVHQESLPDEPFSFSIEDLLIDFVWRWIGSVEAKMTEFVDQAIKQDVFKVRVEGPEQIPLDSQRHSVSVIDMFMFFNQTIDQVYKLDWANEEHVARVMTALARTFAAGIGRYCETVDQQFAREMDRPSAEELAAQTQSTQEKWMQYAKDAWNSKDKVEPFQFYPESFVKLNNIEYAMQELDKLEKMMKVEACALLLEKKDGHKKKTMAKRPNKYTFTIKVVEAEDLKACDTNGYSDPYVVFGDEYQKRLHKTRIIYRNLNPRWDESFEITVQGPINIIATIWDYDTFGDHDYVGRTSLKLDPNHFGDYLPREFWLDLDSQGRILIRVSMEGERDDIEFHYGKAFRHLKRTERDMVRKITDKLTTQINETLSIETVRGLLGTSAGVSITGFWKKRTSAAATVVTPSQIEAALTNLFAYFDDNFAIMKKTLTDATMIAVMTRLWKEVLMTIENLLVPPLSEKPSMQRPLMHRELDIVYHWLEMLFNFYNAKDEHSGEQLGVRAEVLKSPKWHELASLNFFYFEETSNLIRESERMAAASVQRAQALLQQGQQQQQQPGQQHQHSGRLSAPSLGASFGGAGAFASMGTIRRGKSVMMSRNLGTMRKAKEAKRREAQADASDDMILRILRMRPEAAGYLKERHRQRERQAATAAAALIVRNSVSQGWNSGQPGRNSLPRR